MATYTRIKLYTDRNKVFEADIVEKSDNRLRVAMADTTVPLTLHRNDKTKPYTAMVGGIEVRTEGL